MDRKTLMENVARSAVDKRIELSNLCKRAGVSTATGHRYKVLGIPPTLPTIAKLEKALAEL